MSLASRCRSSTESLLRGGHLQADGRAGQAFPQSICKEPASVWQPRRLAIAVDSGPGPLRQPPCVPSRSLPTGPKPLGPLAACRPTWTGRPAGSGTARRHSAVIRPRLACPHLDLAWAGCQWPIGTPPGEDPPRPMTLAAAAIRACPQVAPGRRRGNPGPNQRRCQVARPGPWSPCVTHFRHHCSKEGLRRLSQTRPSKNARQKADMTQLDRRSGPSTCRGMGWYRGKCEATSAQRCPHASERCS